MAAPFITIKVKAGEGLMNRIRKVCAYLDVKPANFIEYAIENELKGHEDDAHLEHQTLEDIRANILAVGQSVAIEAGGEDGDAELAACELCLKPIARAKRVEGPLLCDDCLALAKGATARRASAGA